MICESCLICQIGLFNACAGINIKWRLPTSVARKWAPFLTPPKQNSLSLGYLILSNQEALRIKKTGSFRFFILKFKANGYLDPLACQVTLVVTFEINDATWLNIDNTRSYSRHKFSIMTYKNQGAFVIF